MTALLRLVASPERDPALSGDQKEQVAPEPFGYGDHEVDGKLSASRSAFNAAQHAMAEPGAVLEIVLGHTACFANDANARGDHAGEVGGADRLVSRRTRRFQISTNGEARSGSRHRANLNTVTCHAELLS